MPRRALRLIMLSVLASGCRYHPQLEGSYALSWTSLFVDDCGLYAGTTALGTGSLDLVGDDAVLHFQPFTLDLRGRYRDKAESFFVDGTASNVAATVGSHACQLDMAAVHLDADTRSPTEFAGDARVTYTSIDDAACNCMARGGFLAVLQ